MNNGRGRGNGRRFNIARNQAARRAQGRLQEMHPGLFDDSDEEEEEEPPQPRMVMQQPRNEFVAAQWGRVANAARDARRQRFPNESPASTTSSSNDSDAAMARQRALERAAWERAGAGANRFWQRNNAGRPARSPTSSEDDAPPEIPLDQRLADQRQRHRFRQRNPGEISDSDQSEPEPDIIQQRQAAAAQRRQAMAPLPPARRGAGPQPQGREAPQLGVRGGPQRDPSGNIRFGNRILRTAVSWMFTLHLSGNPADVNYFPYPPNLANLAADANGNFVRPYSVPTVRELQPRPHAPVFILYQLEHGDNGAVGHDGQPLHHNGLHYQGYMEFGQKVSALEICSVMRWTEAYGWNMLDVWLEPRAGKREHAIAYVTKDESSVEVDPLLRDFTAGLLTSAQLDAALDRMNQQMDEDPNFRPPPEVPIRPESGEPRPGDAPEIAKAVEAMILEGASYLDIFKAYSSYTLSHTAGIKASIAAVADAVGGPLEHRNVQTFVFWGDSRTGKTRRIAELEGDEQLRMDQTKVYIKNRKEQYFQHYTNQEVLVLDEFTGNGWAIEDFCALLDGSNMTLPIKYESPRYAKWKRVYITSNIPPRKWFPNATPEQIDAMYNRLNTGGIIKFVNTAKPASMEAHQAELDSDTWKQDRPTVIFKDSTAW